MQRDQGKQGRTPQEFSPKTGDGKEDYSTKDMMKEQHPKYAEGWNKGKYRGKQNEHLQTKRLFVYIEGNWQAKKTEDG